MLPALLVMWQSLSRLPMSDDWCSLLGWAKCVSHVAMVSMKNDTITLPPDPITIPKSSWPRLEHLGLWFGAWGRGAELQEFDFARTERPQHMGG